MITVAGNGVAHHDVLEGHILLVDDDPAILHALTRVFENAGYACVTAVQGGEEAVALLRRERQDLIVLDLDLGISDGLDVLRVAESLDGVSAGVPTLILTGSDDQESRQDAFSLGAKDFVSKPIVAGEISARARNLIETRLLRRRLEESNRLLSHQVVDRTRDLHRMRFEALQRLAWVAEFRDDDTGAHQRRVGALAARLAAEVGLPASLVERLRLAAPLHDIGKIGVPDAILLKPGPLTADEWTVMKAHPEIGARMLRDCNFPLLCEAESIALHHHERWDGTGYPRGLTGERIPMTSRITAVADTFDCLVQGRPYRGPKSTTEAVKIIEEAAGTCFDPALVAPLKRLWERGVIHGDAGVPGPNELVSGR